MSGMLKDGTNDHALALPLSGKQRATADSASVNTSTVVDSIFSPTTKPQAGVVKAMNYSFYGMLSLVVLRIPACPC